MGRLMLLSMAPLKPAALRCPGCGASKEMHPNDLSKARARDSRLVCMECRQASRAEEWMTKEEGG